MPVSESYLATEKIPGATHILFRDTDHHLYMEYPEKFSRLFQHFLRDEWDVIAQFER